MAKRYSSDLRERVAGAVLSGRPCREVASSFGVSVASAVKWSQRLRASGSAAAKPMGGKRRCILASEEAWLLARLEACPHLTVRSLAEELRVRGFDVSHNAVWHQLRRAGFSFKKNAVRRRTGSAQDRQTARAVEEVSGTA
jgi:transposase